MAAMNKLTRNFAGFFKRINPSPTYVNAAASSQSEIRSLLEDKEGPAGDLRIRSFVQGSYGRHTAIHTINDVDLVALCNVSYSPAANRNTRDQIFEILAESITRNQRYRDKTRYTDRSICLKVILKGVKIEVLPALRARGKPFEYEPFYIFRPSDDGSNHGRWEGAYGRHHQELLSRKNRSTNGLFIPMIKVLKHIRSMDPWLEDVDAVSFHLECLLYAVKDTVYFGSTCECLERVLNALAGFTELKATDSGLWTPCRDKLVFGESEWSMAAYERFHGAVRRWHDIVQRANRETDQDEAVTTWKQLLGDMFFPRDPQGS